MPPLRAADLLRVWDESAALSPDQRAVQLLGATHPEWPADAARRLALGERDTHLLQLRRRLFGAEITALARCPACGTRAEARFDVDDVGLPLGHGDSPLRLERDPWAVVFRLPDSDDLAAVDDRLAIEEARLALLDRCVLSAAEGGHAVAAADLPAALIAEVTAAMTAHDPQANTRLGLTCGGCAHSFDAPFDVATFVWSELNAWAIGVLHEVHTLASAYGWSEGEILDLSPRRRRLYLELVAA